jgi:hypothetical protein
MWCARWSSASEKRRKNTICDFDIDWNVKYRKLNDGEKCATKFAQRAKQQQWGANLRKKSVRK